MFLPKHKIVQEGRSIRNAVSLIYGRGQNSRRPIVCGVSCSSPSPNPAQNELITLISRRSYNSLSQCPLRHVQNLQWKSIAER
uniref:Uncharacterized protein n=1 Tax=Noccaea caerulescens TaxID=107243 RepID=A0A1J3JN82_NOCCA